VLIISSPDAGILYHNSGQRKNAFTQIKQMRYREFMDSLEQDACPAELGPGLRALWYDARGDWDTAHGIVQATDGTPAARIHAYLHRKEGDDWNARYWHRCAGTEFPTGLGLQAEWDGLAREQCDAEKGSE
jgi:hypothetical protein